MGIGARQAKPTKVATLGGKRDRNAVIKKI
jgi:hypothetical protein